MPDRALHVAVDGRELTGRPTGVGRYLQEVLAAWASSDTWIHRTTVVVPVEVSDELRARLGGRIEWHLVPSAHAGTWWEQRHLPAALASLDVDVLFAPGYSAPLQCPCPFVVAIYDVSFAAHPEWFSWREGPRRRWLARRAAARAELVVTISEFSAGEITRWLGVRRERIRLAPPGAPPAVQSAPGPRPPTVLFVGSLFKRREIPLLMDAFRTVLARVPDARLVLVGDNRARPPIDPVAEARQAGVAAHVDWRAYVAEADLEALYQSARVFVFLSTYEGFAMTPLEALAHGVPAVLLDTPVAREVYGQGARLVPKDAEKIGQAIADLLVDPREHMRQLIGGRAVLSRYTWSAAASTIQTALERAAARR